MSDFAVESDAAPAEAGSEGVPVEGRVVDSYAEAARLAGGEGAGEAFDAAADYGNKFGDEFADELAALIDEDLSAGDEEVPAPFVEGYEQALIELGFLEPPEPDPEQDPAAWLEWAQQRTEELERGNVELIQQLAAQAGVDAQELAASFEAYWAQQADWAAREREMQAQAEVEHQLEAEATARFHIGRVADEIGQAGVDVDEALGLVRDTYAQLAAEYGDDEARALAPQIYQRVVEHLANEVDTGVARLGEIVDRVGRQANPLNPPDPTRAAHLAAEMLPRLTHLHGGDRDAAFREALKGAIETEAGWRVERDQQGRVLSASVPLRGSVAAYYAELNRAMPEAPPPSPAAQPVQMRRDVNGRFVQKETVAEAYARQAREREQQEAAAGRR